MLRGTIRSKVQAGARKLRRLFFPYSDLDHLIPAEIVNDEFYETIRSLAATADIRTILEIGSSTGEGSTRAFVDGIHINPNRPLLLCLEVSVPRFQRLAQRYRYDSQVRCYNLTSVPLDRFATEVEVVNFYNSLQSALNHHSLSEVLRWRAQDVRYLEQFDSAQCGIQIIKEQNGVDRFDMVLIDGSEFTGHAELAEVYGADYVLLDDIRTFKNLQNYEQLREDPMYRVLKANPTLRNGYAVFERGG